MKCLTLCCILASSGYALNTTQLVVGFSPTQIGQPVELRAALYPRTVVGGTVSFTADGAAIAGCDAVPVNAAEARCTTTFRKPGTVKIAASFSGSVGWGASTGSANLAVGKLEPWVYIAMDPPQPIYGNNLIVNALVLGAETFPPTGSFTFFDNGKEIVTRPLKADGRASLDMLLPVGDHRVEAVYNGDGNYLVSKPAQISFTVSKSVPVVAISSTPAQLAQPVTITVSVTAPNPTGSITFSGVSGCGTVPLAGAVAQCETAFRELGEYPVTANYSGDANLQPGSAVMRIQVFKAVPGLYLAASPETLVYGQTAQVGAALDGARGLPPPGGPVIFTIDNAPPRTVPVDTGGRASLELQLGVGQHTIQALYSGDMNYAPAPPKVASIAVGKGTPVVAISSTPAQVGQPVTITASVTALNPGGTVTFEGAAGCGVVPLENGLARCQTVFPTLGELDVTANYSGDANLLPAKASTRIAIAKAVPSLYVAVSPAAPVYGQTIRVSAVAAAAPGLPAPAGSVAFSNGVGFAAAGSLDKEGRATVDAPLAAGTHSIRAVYNGDANYMAAAPKDIVFTVAKAAPAVTISPTAAQVGQAVVLTVSVSGPNPTGVLTWTGVPGCGTVPLESGRARCQTTYTQLGEFPVTAAYSGDANHEPASGVVRLAVRKAVAGLYLAVAPEAPVSGQSTRVSALLMGASGLAIPGGAIVFSEAGSQTGVAAADREGRGSWTATFAAGVHRVTAAYNGDANYGEASTSVTFTVGRADTATELSAPAGGPFTAKITALAPGSGTPTGTVRFLRDGVALGSATLVGGSATLVSSVSGKITAEYLGDGNFMPSSSSAAAPAPKAVVTLSSDRNPAAAGEAVTFTAVVAPSPGTTIPTGSVQFSVNGASLGTATLVASRASLMAPMPAGSHTVVAAYSGDAVYAAASGTMTQVMSGVESGLTLSASAPAAFFGQPVTFTAQLPAAATGTVRFSDGATPLGSAALTAGAAAITVNSLAPGAHTISAAWAGDGRYAPSSAQIPYTVARAQTTTCVILGTGAATVSVVAVAPGAGMPSGVVQVVNARTRTAIASAPLSEGKAIVVLPRLTAAVVAIYPGDTNFEESASPPASELVALNAASYAGETVAPDEIVSIFGPIPAGVASARVTDSNDVVRDARVLHSAAGQAALVLPPGLAAGQAAIVIADQELLVTVAAVAPGLFTADATGKGAPAGLAGPIEIPESGAPVVLYGTGIRHGTRVECTVGGRPVEVLYAGAQGEFPGLDQVNLLLPASLRGSGSAVLELKVDGAAANPVTLTMR